MYETPIKKNMIFVHINWLVGFLPPTVFQTKTSPLLVSSWWKIAILTHTSG